MAECSAIAASEFCALSAEMTCSKVLRLWADAQHLQLHEEEGRHWSSLPLKVLGTVGSRGSLLQSDYGLSLLQHEEVYLSRRFSQGEENILYVATVVG